MPFSFTKIGPLAAVALITLAGCQPTPSQKANAGKNVAIQSEAGSTALALPTRACSQFLTTGALPSKTLLRAGYQKTRTGFAKKVAKGSISIPGGRAVNIFTNRRGQCSLSVSNAPFRLAFGRNAVVGALIDDGWTHDGNLVYSKGGKRVKLGGGSAYNLVTLSLTPV